MIVLSILSVLLFWTLASVWFFVYNVIYKNGKDAWYDTVMLAPALIIIAILTFFSTLFGLNK